MQPDADLLLALTRDKSQDAFRIIVDRYLGLVYAAARRQAPALAEDVTQAVFLLLWQRAAKVRSGATLAGWLVNTTRLASLEALRAEQRRRRREQVAAEIAALNRPFNPGDPVNNADDLSPLLDQALSRLGDEERTAVVLRYFQDKSLAEVALITGISEAAAAKRVSRGLERLRKTFSRHGRQIPIASIGLILQQHGRSIIVPPALTGHVLGGAAIGSHAAGAAIAKGVLAAMTIQKTIATAATVILLALLVGGGVYIYRQSAGVPASDVQPEGQTNALAPFPGAPAPATPAPATPSDKPKIKVGVVISMHSAVEIFNGSPRGYHVQTRIIPDLDATDVELIPIIESGSENDPGLKDQLQQYLPLAKPILDSDAAGLRSLNVIIAAEVWSPTPDLVANLDAAVSDGVRFFNDGISDPTGYYDSLTHHARNLAGLISNANFGSAQNPVPCTCIENHPILGDLWGFPDITLRPLGIMGDLPPDAKPLIKVTNPSDVSGASSERNFYPLYISHDGKGTIVACTFAPYKGVPEPLAVDGRPRFFLRCVRWLAAQPTLETTATSPATHPDAPAIH